MSHSTDNRSLRKRILPARWPNRQCQGTEGNQLVVKDQCQTWPNQKPEVDLPRYGHHVVKPIWRHNWVGVHRICIKFGRPLQNHMPMTVKRSRSKPEVKCQYVGRLFSETGSSIISAVHWDIWLKFGMLIAFDLLRYRSKPETGSGFATL